LTGELLTFREKIINFSVKINQHYKYLILIFIALGGLFPQVGPPLKFFVPYLIALMTGSLALTCTRKDLCSILREPFSLLLGLALMFGLMPLLSFFLSQSLLSKDFDIAAGLILVASTPSPWAVGIWTGLAGGDVTLALGLLVSSMVLSAFLIPFLIVVFVGTYVKLDALSMLTDLVFMIIIPISFVAAVKSRIKKNLELYSPFFFAISSVAAIILGTIVGATVFPLLQGQEDAAFLSMLILVTVIQCLLSFLVSYFVSRFIFKRSLRHSIALTYSIGSRNNSIAMAIALTYFSSIAALPSIIYLISQVITSSVILKIFERRTKTCENREKG
jgi:BASS family bile acid:Na+ symporter